MQDTLDSSGCICGASMLENEVPSHSFAVRDEIPYEIPMDDFRSY